MNKILNIFYIIYWVIIFIIVIWLLFEFYTNLYLNYHKFKNYRWKSKTSRAKAKNKNKTFKEKCKSWKNLFMNICANIWKKIKTMTKNSIMAYCVYNL